MKATVYAEVAPADTLQRQGVKPELKPSIAKVNTPRQPLADALIQFIVRRPRTFTLVYGSGPALAALWLFISSVQKSEWIWTIVAASWFVSIVTCVGGILYLLSMYTSLSHHPDSQITTLCDDASPHSLVSSG